MDGPSATQNTTYLDLETNEYVKVYIIHQSELNVPVEKRTPFWTVVRQHGKILLREPFLTHEEALQRLISEHLL